MGTNGAIRGFDPFDFPGIPRKQPKTPWTWAHLQHVHGYGNVDRVGSVSVDGAYLLSCFDFRRPRKVAGIAKFTFDVSVITHIHGLGYSYVEIHEHSIDMRALVGIGNAR